MNPRPALALCLLALSAVAPLASEPLPMTAFRLQDDGWVADHLGASMRTQVAAGQFRVAVREDQPDGYALSFRLHAVRRGDTRLALPAARTDAGENRVVLDRGAIVEWLELGADGLEHGFDLDQRIEGPGPLRIELEVEGVQRIRIVDPTEVVLQGRPGPLGSLHYTKLQVLDARERVLSARFAPHEAGLAIEIDDRDALYPVRVDPLLTPAEWSGSGGQVSAAFGLAVATVGDLDHDGYSDVAIGMPLYDGANGTDQGRVRIYRGSASGLTGAVLATLDGPGGSRFGTAVSTAGDMNGDGNLDVAIGAPLAQTSGGGQGRVYVYEGTATGLNTTRPWHVLDSTRNPSQLGAAVSGGGDINGDGLDDIVVGEPYGGDGGSANVYFGKSSGSLEPGLDLEYADDGSPALNTLNARFGLSVAMLGDVNHDGFDDVAIGIPYEDYATSPFELVQDAGAARVYFGGSLFGEDYDYLSPADGAIEPAPNLYFGFSVAGVGDVEADGYADVAVGVPYRDQFPVANPGSIRVYLGRNLVLGYEDEFEEIFGAADDEHFGRHVACAGDVDADGYADIVAGAPDGLTGSTRNGRISLHCGTAGTIDPGGVRHVALRACGAVSGEDDGDRFGVAVATSGDVDGDGFSDIIVGAHLAEGTLFPDEGRAFSFLGSPDGLHAQGLWAASGDARAGEALATAGNLDGDGLDDVVIGAPDAFGEGEVRVYYGQGGYGLLQSSDAGSKFGAALASNCDLNGDGYHDVAVGGWSYDFLLADRGAVWVWYGSEAGVFGDGATAPWRKAGNAANEAFGRALACGDVNGDGRADLIVGASGRVQAFLGGTVGLAADAAWSASSSDLSFGRTVAYAGDVNRDGFGDILVGEPNAAGGGISRGRALLYLGGPDSPSATPAQTFNGEQDAAQFATALAGAGDLNGDGYSDIVIGAFGHDIPALFLTDAGKVYVYYGGPAGPGTAPSWTAVGLGYGSELGRSVAAAGDIDADGYGDLVAGAPSRLAASLAGAVRVYYGGSSGLGSGFLTVSSPNANFGSAVTGADRNGDGFSDVVFSSDLLDSTDDDGRVWTAFGNHGGSGDTLPRAHRARQVDRLGGPVADEGREPTPGHHAVLADAFRVAGRGQQVRLLLETKPLGQPFDGSDQRFSAWVSPPYGTSESVGASYMDLPNHLFHWRARFVSDDPRFPGSAWITLAARGGAELDFRAPGAVTPTPVSGLEFVATSKSDLTWNPNATAEGYDVVRGRLPELLATGGDFAAATELCLANDVTGDVVSDPATPAPGSGSWYLVRAVNFLGAGSYDELGQGAVGPRDPEIGASGAGCP
ncbi:MAG: FG-GAP repeat protein [Acidobacteria bacterium]|nr:FG-GAP repeat protein [Acidobacteriota bacterium]